MRSDKLKDMRISLKAAFEARYRWWRGRILSDESLEVLRNVGETTLSVRAVVTHYGEEPI